MNTSIISTIKTGTANAIGGIRHGVAATKLFCVKHAPEILLGTGIALTTGAIVYSNIVTAKKLPTIRGTYILRCKDARENQTNEKEGDREVVKATGGLVLDCAKAYAIPAALYGLGVFCNIKSHCIMVGRCEVLLAAIASLQAANANTDHGFDQNETECEELVAEPKTCPVDLSYLMDENTCKVWDKYDAAGRLNWIENVEMGLETRLRANGYLFLNEYLDAMRLPKTKEGQMYGWTLNGRGEEAIIDSGIHFTHDELKAYLDDGNQGLWLTPNCTGLILDNFTTFEK